MPTIDLEDQVPAIVIVLEKQYKPGGTHGPLAAPVFTFKYLHCQCLTSIALQLICFCHCLHHPLPHLPHLSLCWNSHHGFACISHHLSLFLPHSFCITGICTTASLSSCDKVPYWLTVILLRCLLTHHSYYLHFILPVRFSLLSNHFFGMINLQRLQSRGFWL